MKDYYVTYFDGACEPKNPGGNMGLGAFILNKERKIIFQYSKYISSVEMQGKTSNNIAEYMALIKSLEYLIEDNLVNEKIICCGDSMLVINQMKGKWQANKGLYVPYYEQAKKLVEKFTNISFEWIPKEKNKFADELSKYEMVKNKCEFRIQKQ